MKKSRDSAHLVQLEEDAWTAPTVAEAFLLGARLKFLYVHKAHLSLWRRSVVIADDNIPRCSYIFIGCNIISITVSLRCSLKCVL